MTTPAMRAMDSLARICLFGLLLVQPLWHGLALAPLWPRWLVVLLAMLPLALPVAGVLLGRPRALFWAGLVALGYFCHGVAEAWASPPDRVPAMVQLTLALALVLAVGGGGWLRRRARGNQASGAVRRSSVP